jgi:hypothetical protein
LLDRTPGLSRLALGATVRVLQLPSAVACWYRAIAAPLLKSINLSNEAHKEWSRRKLLQLLGDLEGKTIVVLGLTYKPGLRNPSRDIPNRRFSGESAIRRKVSVGRGIIGAHRLGPASVTYVLGTH